MDFQGFVDSFFSPTCVVSVKRMEDGGYGEIRLVAGNKKYTDMATRRVLRSDRFLDTFNSSQTANDVLKTCIKLHKATNLKEAMESLGGV